MRNVKALRLGGSLLWALAILVAAFVFKGSGQAEWVEAGLVGLAVSFVVLGARRGSCC